MPQDQEDGAVKIDLPFSQHQAPHSWGFLFMGRWVDLDMKNILARVEKLTKTLKTSGALEKDYKKK